MSLRQVVLPDPLRPSSINVSPRFTIKPRCESNTRSGVTRYSTSRNSIVVSEAPVMLQSQNGRPVKSVRNRLSKSLDCGCNTKRAPAGALNVLCLCREV